MARRRRRSGAWPVLALIGIVAGAAVAVAVARGWRPWGKPAPPPRARATYRVERRDLTISVTEAGEITARSYTDYLCEVDGRPSILTIVPEGTRISPEDVKNGRILVQLDASELQEHLTSQKISFASAEANFTEAKESLLIQHKQNESDIKAAELGVKFALMDLQMYLSRGPAMGLLKAIDSSATPADQRIAAFIAELVSNTRHPGWGGAALQNKRLLESNIKLAKRTLTSADNRLRWTRQLNEKGFVSGQELEQDELALERAQIEVEQTATALELFLEYEFAKHTEQLVSDYQEALRHLDRTRASVRAKLAQAQAKHDSTQATYALQKERLEKIGSQLKACTIRATTAGMVIYGTSTNYEARERDPIEIGDIVHRQQKIITIPNTTKMDAIVRVHESWVERVRAGLPVRVTADPFPDDQFTGKIISVSPLPDPQSRWMTTGLKVYTTRVEIDGDHETLGPGMSAKVEIVIDELNGVLCVPLQAVASRNGLKLCYLVTPEGLEARPVEIGQFNASFIEIKAGLAEGDLISMLPPRYNGQPDEPKKPRRAPATQAAPGSAARPAG